MALGRIKQGGTLLGDLLLKTVLFLTLTFIALELRMGSTYNFSHILYRYIKYLVSILSFRIPENMQSSFDLFMEAALLRSTVLLLPSLLFILLLSYRIGVSFYLHKNPVLTRGIDYLFRTINSVPVFFFVICMFYVAMKTRWFPIGGISNPLLKSDQWWAVLGDYLWHLVLPWISLTAFPAILIGRGIELKIEEMQDLPFIRAAKAAGYSKKQLIQEKMRQPIISEILKRLISALPILITTLVVVEIIFMYKGLGYYAFRGEYQELRQRCFLYLGLFSIVARFLVRFLFLMVFPQRKKDIRQLTPDTVKTVIIAVIILAGAMGLVLANPVEKSFDGPARMIFTAAGAALLLYQWFRTKRTRGARPVRSPLPLSKQEPKQESGQGSTNNSLPQHHAQKQWKIRAAAFFRLYWPLITAATLLILVINLGDLINLETFLYTKKLKTPPSLAHIFGTDFNSYDYLRIMVAAGSYLIIPIGGILFGAAAGLILAIPGALSGRSVLDQFAELLEIIPAAVLILFFNYTVYDTLLGISATFATMALTRTYRNLKPELMLLNQKEFVLYSRTIGSSSFKLIVFHFLPGVKKTFLLELLSMIPAYLLIDASLHYLLGTTMIMENTSIPVMGWGSLLAQHGSRIFYKEWWLVLFPFMALLLIRIGFSLLEKRYRKNGVER